MGDRIASVGVITSRSNPLIKDLAKYFRGRRDDARWVIVEGRKNVQDLMRRGLRPIRVVATEETATSMTGDFPLTLVSGSIYQLFTNVRTPEGILAIFEATPVSIEDLATSPRPLIYLHGVQDPGNIGAVIRVAAAFGAGGILIGSGCASPYTPKVSRGSAGSLLITPFCFAQDDGALFDYLEKPRRLIAAVARGGCAPGSMVLPDNSVLLLGSEGGGLPEDILRRAHELVTIPTAGTVESLNVAVSAGILMYAWFCRR